MIAAVFDTHCHFVLQSGEKAPDIADVLARARGAGLAGLLAVGGDDDGNDAAQEAAELAPGFVRLALGFDPSAADAFSDPAALSRAISLLRTRLEKANAAAIGEIGLDFSHGETADARARQIALFSAQVRLAAELGLPCSVHSRDAEEATLRVLRESLSPELIRTARAGSLHCFVGPKDFADALVPLGMNFGLSGIVTFRNADSLRGIVPTLPRERLLVETDSPFLAPVPLRGKRCEPAFCIYTAKKIAEVTGMDEKECLELLAANALRLFR